MNRPALAILILITCSSCSVYQYNVLSSDIPGKEEEPFTFENDTIQVRYSFPHGQANIEIFNNSLEPLYVDWSRSSVIIDGHSETYWVNESPVSFIPPNSGLTAYPFSLVGRLQPLETNKPITEHFTSETSPLKFTSYLWVSFDQDFYQSWAVRHTFWLSEWQQSTEPTPFNSDQQNIYSTSNLTKGGSAFVGVVSLLGIYAWVVLDRLSEQ